MLQYCRSVKKIVKIPPLWRVLRDHAGVSKLEILMLKAGLHIGQPKRAAPGGSGSTTVVAGAGTKL